ncbi:MAG: GAF domain-containing sensor histidine kinase [Steroidobacteraceae bacterium]
MPTSRKRPKTSDLAAHRACGLVSRIETIPILLRGLVRISRMRFAVVAHVTEDLWVACAVEDQAEFGVKAGDLLDVDDTLCKEVRQTREPIVIANVALDPAFCDHAVPKLFQFQSYISVPIRLPDGTYYGNLCALDREPMTVEPQALTATVELLADLIAQRVSGEIEREIDRAAVMRAHDDTRKLHALDRETVAQLQLATAADKERLEAAALQSGLRDEFIAVLGHDLRNPLAAIVTYAELLKRDNVEELRSGIANRISLSAKRMGDMIGNVMDFTRIRVGGLLPLDLDVVHDLAEVLAHTAKEVQDAHPGRQITIHIDPVPAVRADSVRLQQLASNLLGNAITHGDPSKPVTFEVHWSTAGLDLSVANGGPPIPADRQARLFEPFQQGERVLHGQGLGLGLHISSQVANAHGGALTVESDEQVTRFTARLPLQAV